MTDRVVTERDGHTLIMTLNRRPEKRNAFNFDLLRGLAGAYTQRWRCPEIASS